MKRVSMFLFVVAMVLIFSMQAQAALTTIGQAQYGDNEYNLIWDDDNNGNSVVWLDYTNPANAYAYDTWQYQVNWAAGLNGGGVLTYNIDPLYNVTWDGDWRLPTTVDGPYSDDYNITSSEMGHLFYTELGNKGYCDTSGNCPQAGWGLTNTGDFQNLWSNYYWSGTESSYFGDAWYFSTYNGSQSHEVKERAGMFLAIAVRPGDVAVVPEPVSMVLFGIGGVVLVARRMVIRRRG